MYCRNCGSPMNSMAVVCVSCGVPVGKGSNYCPNCGDPASPMSQFCAKCGTNTFTAGEQKSRLVAGLLGIFLGYLGIHRFYLGYTSIGVLQIIITILTCGIGGLWGFIEGIMIIAGASITRDARGIPLKE